ncbi:MAG: Holliday junction resolvase RuvX [Clostridia bacterium]
MKILAIDYGDSRTGIAISDPLGFMAGRSFVIREKYFPHLVEKLVETITLEKPSEIVLGLPKHMNNDEGDRAKMSYELKDIIEEKTGVKVILWDERTTTVSAHQILSSNGKKRKNHMKTVDAVAASLILEGYLRFKALNS